MIYSANRTKLGNKESIVEDYSFLEFYYNTIDEDCNLLSEEVISEATSIKELKSKAFDIFSKAITAVIQALQKLLEKIKEYINNEKKKLKDEAFKKRLDRFKAICNKEDQEIPEDLGLKEPKSTWSIQNYANNINTYMNAVVFYMESIDKHRMEYEDKIDKNPYVKNYYQDFKDLAADIYTDLTEKDAKNLKSASSVLNVFFESDLPKSFKITNGKAKDFCDALNNQDKIYKDIESGYKDAENNINKLKGELDKCTKTMDEYDKEMKHDNLASTNLTKFEIIKLEIKYYNNIIKDVSDNFVQYSQKLASGFTEYIRTIERIINYVVSGKSSTES